MDVNSVKPTSPPSAPDAQEPEQYLLLLYVAGASPKCITALINLKKICNEHLQGQFKIELIDLLENPKLAQNDQILAIPTLVRKLPEPIRKIIGDLSNTERVLIGLNLRPINNEENRGNNQGNNHA